MTALTEEQASERIANVLCAAGIKAKISFCSCCAIVDIEFPDGARYSDCEGMLIKCDGISHQRG